MDDFFTQNVEIVPRGDRFSWFSTLCKDKKVLHIGCVDSPIFDPNNNLHISLSKITQDIVGLDIDEEGIEELRKHCPGTYYTSLDQIIEDGLKFDVVLMPEVIEHLDNPGSFIQNLVDVDFDELVITAPNCFMKPPLKVWNGSRYAVKKDENKFYFQEIIHPDHNFWFSPWTLKNIIQKNSKEKLNIEEVGLVNNSFSVYVYAKKC